MRYLQPVSHPLAPLLSFLPLPSCARLHLASSSPSRSLFVLLVTVCRPSPGLSFSSTPPRSFANFDFETKRRFLSLIDTSPRAPPRPRPDPRPTDPRTKQASRLALPNPRRITAASGRVIRSFIDDLRTPPQHTKRTSASAATPGSTVHCPAACVCVRSSTSRSCRDCGQQVSRGFPSGSLGVAGSPDCHSFKAQPFIVLRGPSSPNPHTTFRPIFSSPRQRATCIFCKAFRSNTPNSAGRPRTLSRGAEDVLRLRRKGQLPVSDHWFHHSFTI